MGDLIGGGVVCLCQMCKCLCQDPECVKLLCCCLCKVCESCSIHGLEKCIRGCCVGCCCILEHCIRGGICMPTAHTHLHCGNFSCSCASLLLFALAVFCCMVGTVSITTAYQYGDSHCQTPIDTHVIVQGISMFGNAFVLFYICCRYYSPATISFPNPDKSVFPRFHSLFVKDIPLTILIITVSLGFWWSLLGYYWLSGVECGPGDEFLITMASYAIGSEFLLVLLFLVVVYSVLAVAACDEGSCKFNDLQFDCFICCCDCCLKIPEDFTNVRRQKSCEARKVYPEQRNQCLNLAMKTILACGCIRQEYHERGTVNKDEESAGRIEEEKRPTDIERKVVPVKGAVWRTDLDRTSEADAGNRLVGLELVVRPAGNADTKGEDTISKPS